MSDQAPPWPENQSDATVESCWSGPALNPVVPASELPTIDPARFESVAGPYLPMRLLVVVAPVAIVALIAALALAGSGLSPLVVGLGILILTVLVVLVAVREVLAARRAGYLIRSEDFSFRRGVMWRRVDTMPFARVQNVVIRRGPVERLFGLSTLHMQSAGGFIHAFGLDEHTAERLKAIVVGRAASLAEEERADGDR